MKESEKNIEELCEYSCPDCGSKEIINDKSKADIICSGCGLVIDNLPPENTQVRSYDKDEINKIHSEIVQTNSSRRTCIGYKNQWNGLSNLMLKLKKIDQYTKTSYERNLHIALPILESLNNLLKPPEHIKDVARTIYKKVAYNKITKGRSIEKMIVASIYTAYRIDKIEEYTLKELTDIVNERRITNTNVKEMQKNYSTLVKRIQDLVDPNFTIPIPDPLRILPIKLKEIIKPAENSNFENDEVNSKRISLQKTIEILYNNINEKNKKSLQGRSPRGMLAALIYIAVKKRA